MPQTRNSPYKASIRTSFRRMLRNKGIADELIDLMVELQVQMNATLAKLDADTGVADTNYSDSAVEELDPDAQR